jgi:hypothetical protein
MAIYRMTRPFQLVSRSGRKSRLRTPVDGREPTRTGCEQPECVLEEVGRDSYALISEWTDQRAGQRRASALRRTGCNRPARRVPSGAIPTISYERGGDRATRGRGATPISDSRHGRK